MAKVTYKMTGLRELETTLRQIPKAMGRRAGLNALRQGGETIAKMARAIAPVDEGNLRESIDVSTRMDRSQAGVRRSVEQGKRWLERADLGVSGFDYIKILNTVWSAKS